MDGVYVKQADGQPVFHPLPRLCTEEVGDLMQVVRARILSHLARRGVIEAGEDLTVLDDGFAEREPALAQLAAASVAGLAIPAGPRACTPNPCPTRLRRARRPPAPSCAAAPNPWHYVATPASK